jgi:hypothetical protein
MHASVCARACVFSPRLVQKLSSFEKKKLLQNLSWPKLVQKLLSFEKVAAEFILALSLIHPWGPS